MLSAVVTTWNEEDNLPRLVASLKPWVDEIVVVDTESTDGTVDVAKKLGCKVFKHKNTGIVEPVRNFSISKAKGDWILVLDADEEIPTELAKKIVDELKNPSADYYRIARKSMIFGKWIKSGHWWPDYVYRLFKKGAVTWEDTIHSVPITSGNGKELPAEERMAIIHHHYNSIHQFLARMDRYTDFQLRSKLASGYSFAWSDILVRPVMEFLNQYFARQGYSQGIHGLALSVLQAFSEAVLYLKLWEANKFIQAPIKVSDVDKLLRDKAKEFVWWNYQAKIDTSIWPFKYYWRLKRKFNA